jgi:hypothetical protein
MRAALVLVALALPAAGAGPRPGAEGTPESEKAAALVKQLGHPRFAVREAAGKQLLEMGGSALAALTAGTKSEDEEVRTRCAALLPQARAADWKRRADAYSADTDGKQTHDLPLLPVWEAWTGKPDPGSRRLFTDMVRAGGDLLDAAATDRPAARRLIAKRSAELWATVRSSPGMDAWPAAADVAALLLAQAVAEDGRPSAARRADAPAYFLQTPPAADAPADRQLGPSFRRLLAGWAGSRPATDIDAAGGFVHVALRHPLPEGAAPLARIVRGMAGSPLAGEALAALGREGGPPAQADLGGVVAEESSMWAKDPARPPQLRECALAELARLGGKDPKDYGLAEAHRWTCGPGDRVTIRLYRFGTDEARDAGLARWQREAGGPRPPAGDPAKR